MRKIFILIIIFSSLAFCQNIKQNQIKDLGDTLNTRIKYGDSTSVYFTKFQGDTLKTDVIQNAADIAALEDTTDEHRNIIDSLVNENYQYVMVHQQSYLPWSDAMGWGPAAGGDSTMENLRLAFSKDGRRDWIDVGVVFDPVWNLRDPSMIQVGDTFFVACTRNAFAGTGYGYFTIIKSADLFNWTEVANISCAWISEDGADGVNAVWGPKWFYDEIKDSTYLIVSIAHDGQPFQMYAMRALNNNMNSFANGQQLVITDKPSAMDGNVIIKDNQYYIFYKNEGCPGNKCYEMAVGNDFYGPYTVYHEGNWMPSWGFDIESFEIRKFGSVYRLYMDKYYNRDPFKDNGNVGRGYAESYDLINWGPLYDLNIHTGPTSVVELNNPNLYNIRSQRGNPNYLEVGGDPYNYALKMEGIREALKDLDSGVVYVNYPGVDDTTGLGAIPAKKYIRGWIAGRYTNGNAITSFGNDVYLTNGMLRQKLDSITTVYAPQWSGTSTGLNASTARTSLSLNNLTNKAQVELEDSTGGAAGNYITWKRLNDFTGSTTINTLGTVTAGTWNAGAVTSSGDVTAGAANAFKVSTLGLGLTGLTQGTSGGNQFDINPNKNSRFFRFTPDTTAELQILSPNTTVPNITLKASNGNISTAGGINALGSITTTKRLGVLNANPTTAANIGSATLNENAVLKIQTLNSGTLKPAIYLDWNTDGFGRLEFPFDTRATSGLKLGTWGSYPISFWTNSAQVGLFSVNGNHLIGTTDDDGTPAIGRATIKAANNDGSSNILVGRNSSEENKFRVSDRGTIQFDGGFYSKPVNQTNGYTPGANDYVILLDETAGGGDVFMNAGVEGQTLTIKKKDASANAVTLYPDGSETIDGAASYALATQYKYVTMVFSSGHWWIIGNN